MTPRAVREERLCGGRDPRGGTSIPPAARGIDRRGAVRAAEPANQTGAAQSAPASKVAAAAPGIGAAVSDKDLEFTIASFKCGVTVKDYKEITPQGQFCQVDLTIKNNGKDQATVSDSQIDLLNEAGNKYSTSSDTLLVEGPEGRDPDGRRCEGQHVLVGNEDPPQLSSRAASMTVI